MGINERLRRQLRHLGHPAQGLAAGDGGGPGQDFLADARGGWLSGGPGVDILEIAPREGDAAYGGAEWGTVQFSTDGGATVDLSTGVTAFPATATIDSVQSVYGTIGPDTVYGSSYDENLIGGDGDDYLDGRDGTGCVWATSETTDAARSSRTSASSDPRRSAPGGSTGLPGALCMACRHSAWVRTRAE